MKSKILFVCTGNSCRSQMAEGILNSFSSYSNIYSAGIKPENIISPFAVQVLKELGIDISKNYPKSINLFKNLKFDYLLTFSESAKNECQGLNVKNRMHFEITDPFEFNGTQEEILDVYKEVRDEIYIILKKVFSNLT